MARYVVTGGSGFVGAALVDAIRQRGDIAIVASRGRHGQQAGDWIEYDLENPATAANVADVQPDGVFHLAWSTIPSSADEEPAADVRTNLAGTVSLFRLLAQHGIPVVFLSSGGTVYGVPEVTPIPETHPLRPIGAYGMGKAAAEGYAAMFRRARGLDARVARLSNPFGAYQSDAKPQGAASIFPRQVLRRERIKIVGDGSVVRDYVHVSDAAQGILAVLDLVRSDEPELPVYNIGSGQGMSLISLLDKIMEVSGIEPTVEHLPPRPFDVPVNILEIDRLSSQSWWRPRLDFTEAMSLVVEQLRAK